MALTLLVGGARSGKSSLAVDLGRRHDGPVTFVATAPVTDDDMAARIERHRLERPADWSTVEEEVELAEAVRATGDGMVLVDCLTLWVSNLLWRDESDDAIGRRADELALVCGERDDPTVVVSNEVGMGVHPGNELGRRYRDVLGRVNQTVAGAASTTLLLVAGRAIELADPITLLEGRS